MKFKLIGRATVFNGRKFKNSIGMDCVIGVSEDGRFQTVARLADVIEMEA